MRIGKLSALTGVSVRSLRYYEQKQLLQPRRRENKYRDHDENAIERVKTIQVYLSLGLSTEQIKKIIDCTKGSLLPEQLPTCEEELLALYQKRLLEVEKQITLLEQARTRLIERITCLKNQD